MKANQTPVSRAERLEQIRTAINKTKVETERINREARYYPAIALVAFLTSLYAAFKVLHR